MFSEEEGLAQLILVMSLTVLFVVCLLLAAVSEVVVNRERAQSAADAAALAGAVEGRQQAVELATANGGELVGWVEDGSSVGVTVEVDGVSASAWAEDTIDFQP